jgi:hypothetical protein
MFPIRRPGHGVIAAVKHQSHIFVVQAHAGLDTSVEAARKCVRHIGAGGG